MLMGRRWRVVRAIVGVVVVAGLAGAFGVPLPTLGGRRLWTDHRVANGWWLQAHAWTGHARLLDPANFRRCCGRREACGAAMDRLAPSPTKPLWP